MTKTCCDHSDGDNASGSSGEASPDSDTILTQDDIQEIGRPGILGVGGFVLTIVHSEKMNIPTTTVQLPKLPARSAPIVLYLRLPSGEAERLKAAGGTAEFVLQNANRSFGGQVPVADLRVPTSPHLPGDLLYSDQMWVESLDDGLRWQPETAIVAISPRDNDTDCPIDAVIMAGGYK